MLEMFLISKRSLLSFTPLFVCLSGTVYLGVCVGAECHLENTEIAIQPRNGFLEC